jgi:hypothetical protein
MCAAVRLRTAAVWLESLNATNATLRAIDPYIDTLQNHLLNIHSTRENILATIDSAIDR